MYGVDLSVQIKNLMPTVGLGFLLGLIYDFIRLIRLNISKGKVFVFITDMLYVVFCTVSSFLLFLAVNNGHIRAYLIFAELLGLAIYRCSLGIPVYSLIRKFSRTAKKVKKTLFKPFNALFSFIGRFFHGAERIFSKKFKKNKNKLKNLLKHDNEMLYNKNQMK